MEQAQNTGPAWELHAGRYQDTLGDVTADALIVDAPYSARMHGGHDRAPTVGDTYSRTTHGTHRGGQTGRGTAERVRNGKRKREYDTPRRAISYDGWRPEDVRECVAWCAPRVRGWMVSITDHILAPAWADAMAEAEIGRYVFAPLVWYAPGSRVRLAGDGPSCWCCWIIVSRPRTGEDRTGRPWSRWGTLPGGYAIPSDRLSTVVGSKPLALMRALVRDYTRPGDLVLDPCAGGGTTGRAALLEGRRFVGAEIDAETARAARERLAQPYTPPLISEAPTRTQGALDV